MKYKRYRFSNLDCNCRNFCRPSLVWFKATGIASLMKIELTCNGEINFHGND